MIFFSLIQLVQGRLYYSASSRDKTIVDTSSENEDDEPRKVSWKVLESETERRASFESLHSGELGRG